MKMCDHVLYRGFVYVKPPEANVTLVKMMDVESYLNKLLATDAIREEILKYFARLLKVMAHPACEIIEQLQFDYDLIEVTGGRCFNISSQQFVPRHSTRLSIL